MGTIVFDDRRMVPGQKRVPQGAGMRLAAAAGGGAALVGKGLGMLSQAMQEHAEKYEDQERKADYINYQSHVKRTFREAELAAAQTADRKQVEKIYSDWHTNAQKFLTGKNESGVPNIRWKDQRKAMESVLPSLKEQADGAYAERLSAISRQDTDAKGVNSINEGTETGNYNLVNAGIDMRASAGGWTPEQVKGYREETLTKADRFRADQRIIAIEGLSPEEASTAAEEFSGSVSNFEHLNDVERKGYQQKAKEAAANAAANFKKQQAVVQAQSNGAVVDFVMENKRLPGAAERAGMGLTAETVHALEKSIPKPIDPSTPQYAETANSLDYYEFLTRVNGYKKSEDPTGEKLRTLAVEATGFGAGSDRALKDVQAVAEGTKADNNISTESKTAVKRHILNLATDAVKRANDYNPPGWKRHAAYLGGELKADDKGKLDLEKSSGEVFDLYSQLVGFAETLQKNANLTETQYYEAIKKHPVFVQLQDTSNLGTYATSFYRYADNKQRFGEFDEVPAPEDFGKIPTATDFGKSKATRTFSVELDDGTAAFISATGGLYR